jgi:CRP-like cAMP-binding protein
MRKVLYILGQLSDSDIDWIAQSGKKIIHPVDTKLITFGEQNPMLYIVLDGELSVQTNTNFELAKIFSGEILGEMSFIDSRPPSANVIVTMEASVLEISKDVLNEKLSQDPAFGSRFYRAIAMFLSQRMRNTISRMGYGDDKVEEDNIDELDTKVLDNVALAGARFERLMKKIT